MLRDDLGDAGVDGGGVGDVGVVGCYFGDSGRVLVYSRNKEERREERRKGEERGGYGLLGGRIVLLEGLDDVFGLFGCFFFCF